MNTAAHTESTGSTNTNSAKTRSIDLMMQIAGAIALILSPFLPWVERRGVTGSGYALTGGEAALLCVAGVVIGIAAVHSLSTRKVLPVWSPMLMGILAGAGSLYYVLAAYSRFYPGVEFGLFVAPVGAALILLAVPVRLFTRSPHPA